MDDKLGDFVSTWNSKEGLYNIALNLSPSGDMIRTIDICDDRFGTYLAIYEISVDADEDADPITIARVKIPKQDKKKFVSFLSAMINVLTRNEKNDDS